MINLDYVVEPIDIIKLLKLEKIKELIIKKICGIYFLVQDDEIVYVGQSHDIKSRIKSHDNKKVFNKVFYIEVSNPKHLDILETHFIIACNPKYNKTHQDMILINKYRRENKLDEYERIVIENHTPAYSAIMLDLKEGRLPYYE